MAHYSKTRNIKKRHTSSSESLDIDQKYLRDLEVLAGQGCRRLDVLRG